MWPVGQLFEIVQVKVMKKKIDLHFNQNAYGSEQIFSIWKFPATVTYIYDSWCLNKEQQKLNNSRRKKLDYIHL